MGELPVSVEAALPPRPLVPVLRYRVTVFHTRFPGSVSSESSASAVLPHPPDFSLESVH